MTRRLVCLLSVSLAIAHPSLAGATSRPNKLRVEGTRVNVRSKPSLKARVLYQVSQGDVLTWLGDSGKWYKIEDLEGRQGYVYSSLVALIDEPTGVESEKRSEGSSDVRALEEDSVRVVRPGPSKKALLIGGGVALVGVTALLLASSGEDSETTDADGDGFTPRQGDCDDTRSEVNPNGAVMTTVNSNVTGQSMDCTVNSTWLIIVSNNSCYELTVTDLRVDRSILEQSAGCECALHGPSRMTPRRSVVPPGSSVSVIETSAAAGCCSDPGTCSGYCLFRSVYTVNTNAGPLTTPPIQHKTRYGSQCALCSSAIH